MKTIQLFIFTCVAACAYAQDWQYQYLQPFNAPSEFNPALTGVMRSNARVAVSSLVENRTFSTYYNYSQYASSSNKLTFDMPIALDTSGSFIGVGVSVGGYFHNIPYSDYIINQPEFKLNEMPCKLQVSYIKKFKNNNVLSAGIMVGVVSRLTISAFRDFDPITQQPLPIEFSKLASYKSGASSGGGIAWRKQFSPYNSIGAGIATTIEGIYINTDGVEEPLFSSGVFYYQNTPMYLNSEVNLGEKFTLLPSAVYHLNSVKPPEPYSTSVTNSSLNTTLGLKYKFNTETALSLLPTIMFRNSYYGSMFATGLYFQSKYIDFGGNYVFTNINGNYPSYELHAQYHLYTTKTTVGIDPF